MGQAGEIRWHQGRVKNLRDRSLKNCDPDIVRPSESLPEVLGESHGNLADLNEAQHALQLLMGFYNDINRGVLERRPGLPWGCELRVDPIANLEEGAPLSRWARGFGEGYA